jgi:hypothetical protein
VYHFFFSLDWQKSAFPFVSGNLPFAPLYKCAKARRHTLPALAAGFFYSPCFCKTTLEQPYKTNFMITGDKT